MISVKPFAALRPDPMRANRICELPYDVVTSEEAKGIARGNELSFFHISKPEIEFEGEVDIYSSEVYRRGKRNLDALIQAGALVQDNEPAIYIYRLEMGGHVQTGWVCLASCEDYRDSRIKKHEFTRQEKEDDRTRHIEILKAQTGPVFLFYKADERLDAVARDVTSAPPEIDFVADDGIRHSAWAIRGSAQIEAVVSAFGGLDSLYIADGHHRCAAAERVSRLHPDWTNAGFFLSVVFPHDHLKILPYNRLVVDLNELSESEFLGALEKVFIMERGGDGVPRDVHNVCVFVGNEWYNLRFREELVSGLTSRAEGLDASLLQNHVFEGILGIEDPRKSEKLKFVGGVKGVSVLEAEVLSGRFACAFSMFPTQVEDLMAVADEGGIMPPKSTWFEPKLRDALFIHNYR
ncbi:MAG: DUF1015 family protein [Verrucomicrobia bacterium]|nr:DUF1015 family protein [Verrucomicrobiota bacterium]